MNWPSFLNSREHEEPKKVVKEEPIGSFLFATDENPLRIISAERCKGEGERYFTEVLWKSKDDTVVRPSSWRYYISYEQHEEFIRKLSADIKCIVCTSK